jgi:DNA polymerase-3 subunit epsilon
MRQVVLDTETTGLEVSQGHRIIEIGCVEVIDRRATGRHYHQYLNPEKQIDEGALEVHGISNEFLADKPVFKVVANDFLEFIDGSELIIHNAPFDVGFIDAELNRFAGDLPLVKERCVVLDTLELARQLHPGQKNSLDALCKRYDIDNSSRELHGALLDARILADVYLAMTGGQVSLSLAGEFESASVVKNTIRRLSSDRQPSKIIRASTDEWRAHRQQLQEINELSGGKCVWLQAEN